MVRYCNIRYRPHQILRKDNRDRPHSQYRVETSATVGCQLQWLGKELHFGYMNPGTLYQVGCEALHAARWCRFEWSPR